MFIYYKQSPAHVKQKNQDQKRQKVKGMELSGRSGPDRGVAGRALGRGSFCPYGMPLSPLTVFRKNGKSFQYVMGFLMRGRRFFFRFLPEMGSE